MRSFRTRLTAWVGEFPKWDQVPLGKLCHMNDWGLLADAHVVPAGLPCKAWSGEHRPGTAAPDDLLICAVNMILALRLEYGLWELMPQATNDLEFRRELCQVLARGGYRVVFDQTELATYVPQYR